MRRARREAEQGLVAARDEGDGPQPPEGPRERGLVCYLVLRRGTFLCFALLCVGLALFVGSFSLAFRPERFCSCNCLHPRANTLTVTLLTLSRLLRRQGDPLNAQVRGARAVDREHEAASKDGRGGDVQVGAAAP